MRMILKPRSTYVVAEAVTFFLCFFQSYALNIVIPGGTGKVGRILSSSLSKSKTPHTVTILARNAFLASSPSRVSSDFGWLGKSFLESNPNVFIRDWDGGDLLDIVGCDWMGWQEDALKNADIVVNLVGGYTQQRVMATERIVRESLSVNPTALQITVSPLEKEMRKYSPGVIETKLKRLNKCEEMVQVNCLSSVCLRVEMNDARGISDKIMKVIDEYESQ